MSRSPGTVVLVVLAAMVGRSAEASVSSDKVTVNGYPGPRVASVTFDHTVGTGSDRYLLVAVAPLFATPVATVTFGGTPLALIARKTSPAGVNNGTSVELWGLQNPLSGNRAVLIRLMSGAQDFPFAAAVSYAGVDPVTPLRGGAVSSSGTGPSIVLTAATAAGDRLVGLASVFSSAARLVPTAQPGPPPQAVLWSVDDVTDTLTVGGEAPATGASASISWMLTSQREWAAIAVVLGGIAPDAGAVDASAASPDVAPPPDAATVAPDAGVPDSAPAAPDTAALPADAAGATLDAGGGSDLTQGPPPDASALPDAAMVNDGAEVGGRDTASASAEDARPPEGDTSGTSVATVQLKVGCACTAGAAGPSGGGPPLAMLCVFVACAGLRRRRPPRA
jgi:hypothetical protein